MKSLIDGSGTIRYAYLNAQGSSSQNMSDAEWAVARIHGGTDSSLVTGVSLEQGRVYRDAGIWTGATHWSIFEDTVERYAENNAVSDSTRHLTWSALRKTVQNAAHVLHTEGISAGDFVLVQVPNSIAFLETLLGLWKLGAVPIFCLSTHGAVDIEHCIAETGAHYYVGPSQRSVHQSRIYDALEKHPSVTRIEVDITSQYPWGHQTSTESPTYEGLGSELAFLQLSGGTTGLPKLIPKTHDDYLYSVRASIERCDLDTDSIMLIVLPAAHNFTMSSPGILGAMFVGAHSVFATSTLPEEIKKTIHACGITHMALVPPLLLSILNSGDSEHTREYVASLRTLWVGGAKLSSSAAQRVHSELGCTLTQVFGMAEGLVNYTYLESSAPEGFSAEQLTWESIHTQGHPVSEWDEVKVLDPEGNPVEQGEPGDLYTKGPYTIQRYFNPAFASHFTADGFYRTGDIVKQTSSGALIVVGRSKDQINRGGEKISPEFVENMFLSHDAIHNASVVGVPDDILGEKIQAYIIPRPGVSEDSLSPRKLRKFLKDAGLAAYAIPDYIDVVQEFSLTPVGKVSKKDQKNSSS